MKKEFSFKAIEQKWRKKRGEVKHWIDTFVPAAQEDLSRLGESIDWRRSFITTDLNPRYDAFIRWQFNKLKEKGYVVKGKRPTGWCPKKQKGGGEYYWWGGGG